MNPKVGCLALCVLIVVLLGEVETTKAVTCNPLQLSPCASAITSSGNPTAACCNKIKEQRPCLCQYMKNPNLQKFINSPGAKKVASSCGAPFPKC
ncbi:Bifunctional inhibitor/lipid-transfer protein/seed storage 2S albumin superfamily protein [Perilla frutescens var. frutescens]|nr:Bifunctional inhibitor/lipid-transfer protein/seed storage 2S albumin superfamily protein [Perilla frutescens var. frutescens]